MNNKYIKIVLISFFFSCCVNNGVRKEYFPNGNIKLLYHVDSDNKKNGEFKEYYMNGYLHSKGTVFKDTIKIGKWVFYDSDGYIRNVVEYFNIKQKSYVNQNWILNKEGDTIGGVYYKSKMKDTIFKDENLRVNIVLSRYAISSSSKLYLCIPKSGYTLNEDFSNENLIKFDTILNMESLLRNNPKYKNWNHDIIFDLAANKIGNKNVRGFLLEKEDVESDSIDFLAGKIYFNFNFYVKEPDGNVVK